MAAKKQSFEASMARMEEIVRKLEQGDTPLAESAALFEEGTKLARSLHKLLDEAEQKVTVVREQEAEKAEKVSETPFEMGG